jgi:hypothetical protein
MRKKGGQQIFSFLKIVLGLLIAIELPRKIIQKPKQKQTNQKLANFKKRLQALR